jgi:hypothetical protein
MADAIVELANVTLGTPTKVNIKGMDLLLLIESDGYGTVRVNITEAPEETNDAG